jgi:hypothetical protein
MDRYDVHPKLVNFMVPSGTEAWPAARRDELFGSLFGQTPSAVAAAPATTEDM